MTRITRDKGALAHDDRLDAVAGAVSYWVDALAQDAQKAAQKAKDKLMEKELKQFYADQVLAQFRKPTRRSGRRDGFSIRA